MTAPAEFTPSHARPSLLARLRGRAFDAVPLVVWIGAIALFWILLNNHGQQASIHGVVQAAHYDVLAPSDGTLQALEVQENQLVEAGTVLGHLSDEVIQLRLAAARAQLERWRAERRREEAQLDLARSSTAQDLQSTRRSQARRLFRDAEEARLDELECRAKIEEAIVRRDGVGVQLKRIAELTELGNASPSQLTELDTDHAALNKRIDELRGICIEYQEMVKSTRARLDSFLAADELRGGGTEPLLEPLRWRIKAQEVELEQISLAISRLRLRAPVTGYIERISSRPGERVELGQRLLSIVEQRPSAIVAYVPEHLRQTIDASAVLQVVRADAPGQVLNHTILSISPTVVSMPSRLWANPRTEERAVPITLRPNGDETPGQTVRVLWPH